MEKSRPKLLERNGDSIRNACPVCPSYTSRSGSIRQRSQRARYQSDYCGCRHGCPSVWSDRFNDNSPCDWSAINSTLDGMDALLAIVQMPPGIPVATVGINGALNAGILAVQMLAVGDEQLQDKLAAYKEDLKKKIVKANEELAKVSFKYKMN